MNLNSSVSDIPSIGPSYQQKLERLGIKTVEDLLQHTPSRFLDFRKHKSIASSSVGEIVTIRGEVVSKTNFYSRSGKKVQIIDLKDQTGKISLVFFNQTFLLSVFQEGQIVFASGEISWFSRKKAIFAPVYELSENAIHTRKLVPIYPETKGVTSRWLRGKINYVLPIVKNEIKEFLEKEELQELDVPEFSWSLENAHTPDSYKSFNQSLRRLSMNELLFLELIMTDKRIKWKAKKTKYKLGLSKSDREKFVGLLPFTLTDAQMRSIREIDSDLRSEHPMNRLLQGDVGSGKTVVSAFAIYSSFVNGHNSVLMAPTQIVARQHFDTLNHLFHSIKMKIGLVTSTNKLNNTKEFDLLVGTHSLFYKKDLPKNTSVVIIDEQHKFGVDQRNKLVNMLTKEKSAPNFLTMTATPIPRTIALSMFGNLDLSYLDELPKDRKPVTTWVVPEEKRISSYKWLDKKIQEERVQVFVVCPLINESDNSQSKAAVAEFERLQKIFKSRKLGLLHGKLKPQEKEQVLKNFRDRKIDVLVTTPVVEVGVDIPNASIMIIETADRFGLAQLHQLRGRVGRGVKKSFCLLYSDSNSETALKRLSVMESIKSGFELAEQDLKIRGPGDFFGTMQHGHLRLKFADISNQGQINLAKKIVGDIKDNEIRFKKLVNMAQEKLILT